MFINNLYIALRNLLSSKLQSLINLTGLSIGMACSIIIFVWIMDEISFDESIQNKDRIYQLTITHPTGIKDPNVPFILPGMLASAFPEIDHFTRIVRLTNHRNCTFHIEDKGELKTFDEKHVYLVDSSFLSVFSLDIIKGNKSSPLSDPHAAIISQQVAAKYFGQDDPIGKMISLNKQQDFQVTAVFSAPGKSHLNFNIMIPITADYNNWNWSDPSYILLNKNVDETDFNAKIANFFNEHKPYNLPGYYMLSALPIAKSYLGFGKLKYIYISILVALLILLIAAVNYVNLSLANFTKRSKEMMIRNAMGAKRHQLVMQIITEAILLCFTCQLLALILVELTLPFFNQLFGSALDLQLIDSLWTLLVFFAVAAVYGLAVGVYPSIYFSHKQLFNRFKSTWRISKARIYAVQFQFGISILLIICSIVVIKQLNYIKNKPLGIDINNVIQLPINYDLGTKFTAYRARLLEHSGISYVTLGQAIPFNEDYKTDNVTWDGKSPDRSPIFRYTIAAANFPETFKMEMAAGRTFDINSMADANQFVVNEEAVRVMGLPDPIGKKILFWGQEGEIIGVVKDFHHVSLHREILPHIISINPRNFSALRYIFIKLKPDNIAATLDYIRKTTSEFSPERLVKLSFIERDKEQLYADEKQTAQILVVFSLVALLISSLGIFGMTALLVEHRTKEISIRKINGASVGNIIYLLNKKIVKWVILATVITGPVAIVVSLLWLTNFAYRTSLSWWVVLIAAGIASFIALITSSYETIKAALQNPVKSLRID